MTYHMANSKERIPENHEIRKRWDIRKIRPHIRSHINAHVPSHSNAHISSHIIAHIRSHINARTQNRGKINQNNLKTKQKHKKTNKNQIQPTIMIESGPIVCYWFWVFLCWFGSCGPPQINLQIRTVVVTKQELHERPSLICVWRFLIWAYFWKQRSQDIWAMGGE